MARKFIIRRGPSSTRPTLGVGEMGIDTDGTNAVWIGTPAGTNKKFGEDSVLGGSGEANVGSNYGTGAIWYAGKSGVDLGFKTVVAGANITLSTSAHTINIVGATPGETNTGSSYGTGVNVYAGKSGVTLGIHSLVGSNLHIASNAQTINLTLSQAGTNLGTGKAVWSAWNGTLWSFRTLVGSNIDVSQTDNTINLVASSVMPFSHVLVAGSHGWANMPAAETQFPGAAIMRIDLTNAKEWRLAYTVNSVGTSGAILYIMQGTSSSSLVRFSNVNATISSLGGTVTDWTSIIAGSNLDTYITVYGSRGNGAVDPSFGGVCFQTR